MAEQHVVSARLEAVRRAVQTWIRQLEDYTGRNRLLYYRDLKVGSLDLTPGTNSVFDYRVMSLLAGNKVKLRDLFEDDEDREDAVRRARAIVRKATENLEERGLETQYLGIGMATWDSDVGRPEPRAPVVLVPLELQPLGAALEEFILSIGEESQLNPSLGHLLEHDYNIALADDRVSEAVLDLSRLESLFSYLTTAARSVPGFRISDRLVVSNFSFAKLPMLRDLQDHAEELASHDLIAALAGDKEARELVRERRSEVDVSIPDETPAEDEFLILDSDSSQNLAINRVLGGEDLVIQGPPGTGKSQTIANLIATLVSHHQKVLFVAEKRAAIDAVVSRLERVGLRDLVMDIHGGIRSRRTFAMELQDAIESGGRIGKPDLASLHLEVNQVRERLRHHDQVMHRSREPWGLSAYQVLTNVAGTKAKANRIENLPVEAGQAIASQGLEIVKLALSRWVRLEGPRLIHQSGWSPDHTGSAAEGIQLLREAEGRFVHLVSVMREVLESAGLSISGSVRSWVDPLNLLHDLVDLSGSFNVVGLGPLFEQAVDGSALARKRGGVISGWLLSKTYRDSIRYLKRWSTQSVPQRELQHLGEEAAEVYRRWLDVRKDETVPNVSPRLSDAIEAYTAYVESVQRLQPFLRFDVFALDADATTGVWQHLKMDEVLLRRMKELQGERSKLFQLGLRDFLNSVLPSEDPDDALATLEASYYSCVLEQLRHEDDSIAGFAGKALRDDVRTFTERDEDHIDRTSDSVRRRAAEWAYKTLDDDPSQGDLIRAQAKRKRGHLPPREVMHECSDLLTAIKPCWAMSPLLVSQLLPPAQLFDVVIFDEASQVLPADAVPALLRAKRAVVAGDSKQLPPTTFFVSSQDDSEEVTDSASLTKGFESILDVLDVILRSAFLRWHYRSRDERLIAFSNAHLYDKSLMTFPGVTPHECLSHELVDNSGDMDQASSSSEVRRVVELILGHARERSDESLGVIALGLKHAERIEESLRLALTQQGDRNDLEGFFDASRDERFFVKNLERVQGDERDAIILSVGYGRGDDGRLRYHFGPLLQEGGERRLNVAITRARKRMTVCSAFSHEDLDPARSSARGVELLRRYLAYAASGGGDLGKEALDAPELNAFEIDVKNRLSQAGMVLHPQFGVSGYRIDFAAAHPKMPGKMVLAIECDGASYHSCSTVRDRDRLRQQKLEELGWRFHRIWSLDWFNDPEHETSRVLAAWAEATSSADERERGPSKKESREVAFSQDERRGAVMADRQREKPRLSYAMPVTGHSFHGLVELAKWVESDELLRTEEDVVLEMMSELGYRRKGTRIVQVLTQAVRHARAN